MRTGRPLFLYLGRRGALSAFTLELARAAGERAVFCISRQNELHDAIAAAGAPVVAVDTFASHIGAILRLQRLLALQRRLESAVAEHGIGSIVVLMPHVWTPLLRRRRLPGLRYVVIVHDADRHPGDRRGLVNRWLLRDAARADCVVTLSAHVARRLAERGFPEERLHILFHPVLGQSGMAGEADGEAPSREPPSFLFFGRIMAYKGLPLFVAACEMLRREGLSFGVAVVGEGDLGPLRPRLEALAAVIDNRWIAHDEVAGIMARFDAVVLPNTEASQSGVAATALGHGVPVIATPAGGVVEQITDGETGLLAETISAEALAAAMRRFLAEPQLRRHLKQGATSAVEARSVERLLERILSLR
jgi:glycosyltransferase involved in cell wall biosynthesis